MFTKIQGAVFFHEPMSRHTTMQSGGPADIWIEPAGLEDCKIAQEIASTHDLPIMTVGRGSNLLVRDGGIRGIVLHVGAAFQEIKLVPSPSRGEGQGGGENAGISAAFGIPLPLAPSHQGRGKLYLNLFVIGGSR